MNMDPTFAWTTLLLLGALHGINPAMGWLFAVSLGLQEGERRVVWKSLVPMAAGHAVAVTVTLIAALAIGLVVPLEVVKWIAGIALVASGLVKLRRHVHPRLAGMRVRPREIAVWSFLMASAHGAGLMALPFVLGVAAPADGVHHHASVDPSATLIAGFGGLEGAGLLAVALHTAGYLAVAGLTAAVVYEKLGLRLLRTAWINIDLIWAGTLVVTGVLTPLL